MNMIIFCVCSQDWFSELPVFRAADPLAVEQNPTGGIQGDRAGRRHGRHPRHPESRQRRELLRRASQLHLRHEEPSGKVQRSQIRRPVGTRQVVLPTCNFLNF